MDYFFVDGNGIWLMKIHYICIVFHPYPFAVIAQLVEHRLPKPRVTGSSPAYRSLSFNLTRIGKGLTPCPSPPLPGVGGVNIIHGTLVLARVSSPAYRSLIISRLHICRRLIYFNLHKKKEKPLSFSFLSSGGRTRTCGLRVMSPTSCQLLYPAMYLYVSRSPTFRG